jgi:DNA (cytosine-5)-methyltransferase 1
LGGFELACAVDINEYACKTYEANLGLTPLVENITKLTGAEILRSSGMKKGEPSVLIFCVPCQGFTRLRKKKFDPRNRLVFRCVDLIGAIKPQFVFFENVSGILTVADGKYFNYLRENLTKLGYNYTYDTLDAVNFGIPQFRRRVLLLATRSKRFSQVLDLPLETHTDPSKAKQTGLKPWITVRDAISDLPALDAGESDSTIPNHEVWNHSEEILKRIRRIPKNGGSRKDLDRRLWLECHSTKKNNVGFNDVYGRLKWNAPAVTITSGCNNPSKGRFIHPEQDRGLSPREAARLQSFPDRKRPLASYSRNFVFHGPYRAVTAQIGNAFPPRWSLAVARAVRLSIQQTGPID